MTPVSRYAAFVLNAALICCFSLFSIPLHSQTLTTGQVMGRVSDPSGAAIPAASVELQDAATGTVRKGITDQQGQYTFALVTPGRYSVTVTAAGFQKAILNDVAVEVSKSITVNMTLHIGQVSQVVHVTATPGAAVTPVATPSVSPTP